MTDAVLLLIAIACELSATGLLKASNGLTRFWPSAGVVVGYLVAFMLLACVLKRLPVGPVYATWAGLGSAGAALVGCVAFGERLSAGGWLGLGLVVLGVILLGLFTPHSDENRHAPHARAADVQPAILLRSEKLEAH